MISRSLKSKRKLLLKLTVLTIYPLCVLAYTWTCVFRSDLDGRRHGPSIPTNFPTQHSALIFTWLPKDEWRPRPNLILFVTSRRCINTESAILPLRQILPCKQPSSPVVNSTINLSFRYMKIDYVRALRSHYASRLRLRLDIVFTVILVGIGAYLWRSPTLHWLGLSCLVVAIAFALMLIAVFALIPRLAFRREPKFRDDYSLTFSPDGIHFRTAHVDSHLQWSMYQRAMIDSHSYILYYGTFQFTVIPKRVFLSVEQQQEFEKLLAQHISKIVRRAA